jgi:hypothetical protein
MQNAVPQLSRPSLFSTNDLLNQRFRLRRGYGVTSRIAAQCHT